MIQWMAYAAVVGGLVAGAGWAAERLVESQGLPRRGVWLGAICLAVCIPLFARPAAPPATLDEAPTTLATPSPGVLAAPPAVQAGRWDAVALTLWSVGSAVGLTLIGLILGFVSLARRRWPLGRIGSTRVHLSERFGPALVGVVRPAIVVPSWISRMEVKAAKIIVGHEEEHRRAGDHLTLLFGGIVTALLPWNPAIWWMSRRLRAAVEIDCDRRLLLAGTTAVDYGEVLLQVGARPRSSWGPIPALTEPKSLLERRLRTMGQGRRRMSPTGRATMTALAVLLVATACETPAPTGVQNAMDAAIGVQRAAAQEVDTPVRVGNLTFSGDTLIIGGIRMVVPGDEPLIFVNNELINTEGQDNTVLESINPDDIERVEVIKGARARETFGPRGARSGVVQIFMKGYDPPQRSPFMDQLSEREAREVRDRTVEPSLLERAREEEYQAAAQQLREAERALAEELKANERNLQTARERYAGEMVTRVLADEALLKQVAEKMQLREQASLEQAKEQALAAKELQRETANENTAMLKAQVEELTARLRQLERKLKERTIR